MSERYEVRLPTGGVHSAATGDDLRAALLLVGDVPGAKVVRIAEDGTETELDEQQRDWIADTDGRYGRAAGDWAAQQGA